MKTVIIIGGGAAGLVCANELVKENIKVIILEQSNKLARKILASGNGHCNLTNLDMDIKYYNHQDDLIKNIIDDFDAVRYFNDLGMLTTTNGNLVYPYSNQSSTVKNILLRNLDDVEIVEECLVKDIKKQNNGYLLISNQGTFVGDDIVIATGSPASNLSGNHNYDLFKSLDVQITKLNPSLVAMKTKPLYKELKGVRVKCSVSLEVNGKLIERQKGEIIFNDTGISGICIMQLSRLLPHYPGNQEIVIDFMDEYSDEELKMILSKRKQLFQNNYLEGIFNDKLVKILNKENDLKRVHFKIVDTLAMDRAQVTNGGVSLKEVDENLQLIKHPSIYVAGEVLDVDGDCGGYNLHFAFASGYHVARKIIGK